MSRAPGPGPDPAAPELVFAVLNEVGIIHQLSSSALLKVLPDGLQIAHFSVLNHMGRLGDGWTPVRLARAFQVTKGAMTNTLQRLEARALVRIEPDPKDRRAKRVFFTDAGREMHTHCLAALGPELARMGEAVGAAPFETALPALQAIRAWLDEDRDAPK
jgi:DNA-binding MarR family transcriptional regulator